MNRRARCGLAPLAAGLAASCLVAHAKPNAKSPAAILPGAGSHEPININADKLDYFDKEQKLVYSGAVVAVQGDSTLKASQLTIFFSKTEAAAAEKPASGEAAATGAPGAGSSVRHMDAKGPVSLISKDQIGTGDNGAYDRDENRVTLTGNVTLSQGPNVTRGDRLVYDLTSGQAQMFAGKTTGRVSSVFTPGSAPPGGASGPGTKAPAKKKDAAASQ